jgi:hypothetical protein
MPNLRGRHLETATPLTAASTGSAPHGVAGIFVALANAGAASNCDLVLAAPFRIARVVFVKGGTNNPGGAADTVRLWKGAGAFAITPAIAGNVNVGKLGVTAQSLDTRYTSFVAGDTLRIALLFGTGTDNGWRVLIMGFTA